MDFTIEDNILKGAAEPMEVDRKLGKLIMNALNESPNNVGQIDAETGEQTTCSEMKDRSVRCAVWMKKLAIRPSDVVVIVSHNHLDCYVPFFATFFVDAVFNAWSEMITLPLAQRFMKEFTPKLIFANERAIDVLIEAAALESLNVEFVVFGKHSSVQSLNEILDSQTKEEIDNFALVDEKNSRDLAAIALSSGSSGFPKEVMMSHMSLAGLYGKDKRSKNFVSQWYSTIDCLSCVYFILQTVLEGGTRMICNRVDLENLYQVIEKYKVNFTFVSPMLVNQIAKCDTDKNYDLRSVQIVIVGGARYARQILDGVQQKFPNTFIFNIFGSTETGGGTTFKTPEVSKNIHSIGFIAPNCQMKFVDLTSGKALGPNQKGEIYVKSPNIAIGYYKNDEVTKRAFDADGWYHTGDIGYYDEAGEIFIYDRINEMIKYRTNQISPVEIEEVLLSHRDVLDVAVVKIPDELDGELPVAFVKKMPGSQLTEDDIIQLTSVLEDYKKLRGGIYFLDNLPRTRTGKLGKYEMIQLAQKFINEG